MHSQALVLKESYFCCHKLSPIVFTPPCIFCLTFCLQHLTNSAEGKLSYSALFVIFFPQAVLAMKKKIPKHPICLTENECATTYGVECFRISPGAKDSETIVDCNRRFLFMSFRERCVFLGSKFDFSLLIESLLLAFESYSLTTLSPSYSDKLIQGLLE